MEKDELSRDELAAELSSMDDKELKTLLEKLSREEERISFRRRIIHGKIDVLRAELVRRLKVKKGRGERLFTRSDIDRLSDILAKEASGMAPEDSEDDLF